MRKRGQRLTRGLRRQLKREFLRQYQQCSMVSETCRSIGLGRATFYAWLKRDVTFAQRYCAIKAAREAVEQAKSDERMAILQREYDEYWEKLRNEALNFAETRILRYQGRKV